MCLGQSFVKNAKIILNTIGHPEEEKNTEIPRNYLKSSHFFLQNT